MDHFYAYTPPKSETRRELYFWNKYFCTVTDNCKKCRLLDIFAKSEATKQSTNGTIYVRVCNVHKTDVFKFILQAV